MDRPAALARAAILRDLLGKCLGELRRLEGTALLEASELNAISAAAGFVERAEDWMAFVGVRTS
jgi:hypothetical protein